MKRLRHRSLYEILNSAGFRRISFEGLKNDFPIHWAIMMDGYKHIEGYEMLDILENKYVDMDKIFAIFVTKNNQPIVFEIAEHYLEQDYTRIFKVAGITLTEEVLNGYLALSFS